MGQRPWAFFALLVTASSLAYLPMAYFVNPMSWFELGPFTMQSSRALLYALYFVFGIGLGAYGVDQGLLSKGGNLARKWILWQGVAPAAFIAMLACVIAIFAQMEKGAPSVALQMAASFFFVVSCAASSLMFLSFFVRFGHWAGPIWRSLDRNAYGMFLVHYVFATWLQYALLDLQAPGVLKAAVVASGTVALSWGTSILLRRIPAVGRLI